MWSLGECQDDTGSCHICIECADINVHVEGKTSLELRRNVNCDLFCMISACTKNVQSCRSAIREGGSAIYDESFHLTMILRYMNGPFTYMTKSLL